MKRLRPHLLVFLLYLLVAVVMTWPLVTVMGTHFAGFPFGDAHEMTRHIWWFTQALRTGAPLIDQPLLGYPDGMAGVILWADLLQFFPAWLFALALPLPAAYNLQALLNLALNGWAAWVLMRVLAVHSEEVQSTEYRIQSGEVHSTPFTVHSEDETRSTISDQPLASSSSPHQPITSSSSPSSPVTRHSSLSSSSPASSSLAPFLVGLIFMTAPTIQGHLAGGHGGLLVQWPLPLLALVLWRVIHKGDPPGRPYVPQSGLRRLGAFFRLEAGGWKLVATIALITFLVPLGHTLQLIYAVLPLVAAAGLTLLIQRRWRALFMTAAGVGGGALALGLFLLPVWSAGTGTQAYTDAGGSVAYSLDLLAPVTPSFNHPLWGGLAYTRRVLGINLVEGSSYVGLVAGGLALIGLWRARAARWWLLPLGIAWVSALGPLLKLFDQPLSLTSGGYASFVPLPWAMVADLPGIELARTPGRFNFVMALVVAVLAGYGVQAITPRPHDELRTYPKPKELTAKAQRTPGSAFRRSAIGVTVILALLIVFDYQFFWPLPTYDARIPQAVSDLRGREDVRAVFDLPWDNLLAAKDALWLQTAHQQPIIAGQVTRETPVSPAKLTILEETLHPGLLHAAGVGVVILHRHYDGDNRLLERATSTLGEPFFVDERYALFNVPVSVKPPSSLVIAGEDGDERLWHIYAAEPGRVLPFTTPLLSPRPVIAAWGETRLNLWQTPVEGGYQVSPPILYMRAPGYYTLRLRLEPACPLTQAPLTCATWPELPAPEAFFTGVNPAGSAQFAEGVQLVDAFVPAAPTDPQQVILLWQFSHALPAESIRFVKLLVADGTQAAGWDDALPTAPGFLSETIDLSDVVLVAGQTYRICLGWYSLPDVTRFELAWASGDSQDNMACVGTLTGG